MQKELTQEQLEAINKAYEILIEAGLEHLQIGAPYPKPKP